MYVQITVNRKGYVVDASIIENSSTSLDACLVKAALDAALAEYAQSGETEE